jgi:hypothetical protein
MQVTYKIMIAIGKVGLYEIWAERAPAKTPDDFWTEPGTYETRADAESALNNLKGEI